MSKAVCKVSVGDFSLDNTPQFGRPFGIDSDQIETLIEDNNVIQPGR